MIRNTIKLVIISLLLTSCSQQTTEEYIAQAENYLTQNKTADAEITLKKAILEYPSEPNLRERLGELYLSQGLATIAEKEIGKALELGAKSNENALNYLAALNMQLKVEDVLNFAEKEIENYPDLANALHVYSGIAYHEQNFPSKAKSAFNLALEVKGIARFSQLADTYLALYNNQPDDVVKILDEILRGSPNFAEALSLKGKVLYNQKKFSQSAQVFNTYINTYPNAYWMRIYYARSLVRANSFNEAGTEINRLLAYFPNQPLLNSLKSTVEFENENYQLAKEHAERAMLYGDRQDTTTFIAAVSSMRLENYEQAYSYMESLANKLPKQHPIHKLFAIAQFKLGYFDDAANSITAIELDGQGQDDLTLYSSMSLALLESGHPLKAQKLIEKTESLTDDSPEALAHLGKLKLAINDMSGVEHLIESLSKKPDQIHTRLMLVTAYIQNGEFEKSLDIAKRWQDAEPNNVESINLEAFIHYKKGDLETANSTYIRSLKIEPANFVAHLFVTNHLVSKNDFKGAESQMARYLSLRPSDARAFIQLYLVKRKLGETKSLIPKIQNEYSRNPSDQLKMALAKIYNAEKMYQQAANLLMPKDASEGHPNFYWQILVESLINLNDHEKTQAIISTWKENYPASLGAIAYEILLLEGQGKIVEAAETLSIWNKNRNVNQFLLTEALLNLRINRLHNIKDILKRISDDSLQTPLGKYLLGRVEAWEGNSGKAKTLFQESYISSPKDETSGWLAEQIYQVNGKVDALVFLEEHLEKFPSHVHARTQLANLLKGSQPQKAKEEYKVLLTYAPQNVIALNNLALIAYADNQFDIAEKHIDAAVKIAGNIPDVLDSAATIKLKVGKTSQAIELIKKAHNMAPRNNSIKINHARILEKAGSKQKALRIINNITPENKSQKEQIEALNKLLAL